MCQFRYCIPRCVLRYIIQLKEIFAPCWQYELDQSFGILLMLSIEYFIDILKIFDDKYKWKGK